MVSNLVGGIMGSSKRNLQCDSSHRGTEKSRRWTRNARGSGSIAAAVMMSLFFVGEARATTYYVDKATGSDSRAGTATSTAWATMGKANATLRAGDTVYVRAGTYDEIIEPYQSGAAGAPITYQNYQGETVVVRGEAGQPTIVAIGIGVHGNWNPKSYIVVDGFTLRHINPSGVSSRPVLVYINDANSRYNVIRNCTIQAQGSPTWGGGIEDGLWITGAKYTLIENNHISGYPRLGINLAYVPQYTTIRGNDIRDCSYNCINVGSSQGTMQYNLIENNVLDHSVISDGIQFESDYSLPAGTVDYDSNRGTVLRNNIISNHAENGIDLKGAAYIIIEGNIVYGCTANDDGGLNPSYGDNRFPGANTIMHGTGPSSRNVLIRRNVLYDGQGGISPEDYYKVYNNTIIYNNRDYTGSNSSWGGGTAWPTFVGICATFGKTGVAIKNNIVGGHNASDICMGRNATALDIDNNLYFNDNGALLVDFVGLYNWSLVPFSQWSSLLASQGVLGADAHALQAAPLFVKVPADPTGPHTNFDFHLQSGSPAIDHGGFLTTTTSAGQGTSVPVKDAGYFFDGWGIVAGDTIQLQGQNVTAQIVSISSNTLVVDKSLTWSAGQGVSLAYQGSAPDMGAYEYGGSSPAAYTLTVSAANGTVTKTPDQTSYTSGQTVTLQATPNTGYTFSGWSGDLTGTTNPATLVMNGNKSVTANFAAAGSGAKTVGNMTVSSDINTDAYRRATPCTVPEAGQLQSISIYHEAGSGQMILAVYADNAGTPDTRLGVTNSTTVSSTAGWQTVPLQSPVSVSLGQQIWLAWVFETNPGLHAAAGTPGRAQSSDTWAGGMPSSFGLSTAADFIYNVYATYTPGSGSTTGYTLTVSAANGTVTKTPDQTSYTSGQTVTLQATPNTGYTFSGWSGDLTGTTNPATLVMNANKSVAASFTASTKTVGNMTLSTDINKDANRRAAPYTMSEAGQLQSISIYHEAGSGQMLLAVYADSAGLPGTRLGVTNSTTVSGTAGWQTVPLQTPVPVTSGQQIWLAWVFQTNPGLCAMPGTPGRAQSSGTWTGGMPTSFGTATTTNWLYSIYASYTPASGSTLASVAAVSPVGNNTADSVTKRPATANFAVGDPVASKPTTDVSLAPNPTGAASNTGMPPIDDAVASASDQSPPVLGDCSPTPDSIQAAPDTLVVLRVCDEGQGVDAASVSIQVDDHLVYTGDAASYRTDYGVCTRSGTEAQYTYAYQQQGGFRYGQKVVVAVQAQDRAGNVMPERTYSFATEMYSFGVNRSVSMDQIGLAQGRPATVRDGQGNVWILWHAGTPGSRHVYAARLQPDGNPYGGTMQLSHSAGDHCNPAVAIDGTGTLYVVWQEDASGVWDVRVSTSIDGQTWSAPKPLAGTMNVQVHPAVNRVYPVVAAGRQSSGLVAVAWQEGPTGNQDICVACSTNRFETATVSRVTFDPADQTDPSLAVDGQDTIFVLWTDARNGSTDIYGAASNAGPWTNVPVVEGENNQSHPALAAGFTGRTLHLAWVEDKTGNLDVFYAVAEGLPISPLTGASIIDDTSGADQRAPALGVAAGAEGTDRVFVCWEDARNLAYSGDVDVYFADVSPGSLRTNVLVDDDGTSGSQHEVTLGTDRWGYPYVVWVGDLDKSLRLHYSGATYVNPVLLAEGRIMVSAGGLIGTSPQKMKTLDDVSLAIPAAACPFEATIRAARICNSPLPATESPYQVGFEPGGLTFARPVTITIPYRVHGVDPLRPVWLDAATGTFRDEGITDIRSIYVAPGLRALQFQATHLGSFYLVSEDSPVASPQLVGGLPAGTRR